MQFLDLNFVVSGIRWLMAMLCQLIYPIISFIYDLFINMTKLNILYEGSIAQIYQRITMILTIIMIFYVTFEFVKFVVQPEGITDKQKGAGNIVFRMVMVVILIAIVPDIFAGAFKIQNRIINSGVIHKVIIGPNDQIDPEKFGPLFSTKLFELFYSVDDEYKEEECGEKRTKITCGNIVTMNKDALATDGELPYLTTGLDKSIKVEAGDGAVNKPLINFEFHGLLAVLVGGFVAYILILYCIDVGVRWAQLIYLQVIAPIPIIGYLAPQKDGIFQKWCKQCITTYLDLFIRTVIIYLILFICNLILNSFGDNSLLSGLGEISPKMETFIYVILIMGVLLFAQKAPKMLQELFPKTGAASGNFGLKAGERVAPMAARAIGLGAGGLNSLVRKGISSAADTHRRNKAIKEKRKAEGKDTSRRAIRQERRQARLDEKHARRQNRQASRTYNQEQRATRKERNDVLDAERELAEAKRSGNQARIKSATEKFDTAKRMQENKKAELRAEQESGKARRELDAAKRELEKAKGTEGEKAAQDRVKEAERKYNQTQDALLNIRARENRIAGKNSQAEYAKKTNEELENIEKDRAEKEANVKNAEQKLAEAKASGDPNAIAEATKELKTAIDARDRGTDVYQKAEAANAAQQEYDKDSQVLTDAELKHSAATNATIQAQTKLDNAKEQGKIELAAAQAALDEATKSGDKDQIKIAQEEFNKVVVANNTAISKAQTEFENAQENETKTKQNLDSAKQNRDASEARRTSAQAALEAAEKTRDRDYIQAKHLNQRAQETLTRLEQQVTKSDIATTERSTKVAKEYQESKEKYATAQSDRAAIENERYRSSVASGMLGAATGAATGMWEGGKATKLEDIRKQVESGQKKVIEQVANREKWLDAGGTTFTSKVVSAVEKNLGILTDAQISDMQTRNYDVQISTNKRLSAIEGAPQANLDSSKDRAGSKIEAGEQKTKLVLKAGEKLKYKDAAGNTQILNGDYYDGNKTTSEIYQEEKTKAQSAREKASAAAQAAATARAEGKPNAAQLEMEAEMAAKKATQQEQALGQIKKALQEYSITNVLQTPKALRRDATVQPDQVLVDRIENTLQSIEESKRNSDTYNKMLVVLGKLGKEYVEAYTTGNIVNFDQIDKIQAALVTIKGERDRQTSTLEAMQGIWKASSKLEAEKAADGATGGKH